MQIIIDKLQKQQDDVTGKSIEIIQNAFRKYKVWISRSSNWPCYSLGQISERL